jgi:2-keto-4-pentenoate hydratase
MRRASICRSNGVHDPTRAFHAQQSGQPLDIEQGGVRAGQFVTCGTYTGLRYLKPGDICGVRFEGLGAAEVTFVR